MTRRRLDRRQPTPLLIFIAEVEVFLLRVHVVSDPAKAWDDIESFERTHPGMARTGVRAEVEAAA